MAERKRPASVHGRLLSYLLVPLFVMLVAGVAVDHHVIVSPIHNAFDHSLSRSALAIVARIRPGLDGVPEVALPQHPPPPLRAMSDEHFFYRVSLPDGTTIAGTPDLPRDLWEAAAAFAASPRAAALFGAAFVQRYALSRRHQLLALARAVSSAEKARYFESV